MSEIKLVRIYEHEQPSGYRILVDRLWPRGMSKVNAKLDEWDKQMGPSTELRKWFNHEDEKFSEFKKKYIAELEQNDFTPTFIKTVKEQLKKSRMFYSYSVPKTQNIIKQLCLRNMLKVNYNFL